MGFVMTFFPQFLLGNAGMPRRYASYPERFWPLHVLSTGGAFVLGLALVLALGNLIYALCWGPRAPANPWQSLSFEWLAGSPPRPHNFDGTPVIERGPYDYFDRGRIERAP